MHALTGIDIEVETVGDFNIGQESLVTGFDQVKTHIYDVLQNDIKFIPISITNVVQMARNFSDSAVLDMDNDPSMAQKLVQIFPSMRKTQLLFRLSDHDEKKICPELFH